MTDAVERARDILEGGGLRVVEVRPLPNGYGSQLRCEGGEVLVAYLSGKFVAQGKNAGAVRALFDVAPPRARPARAPRLGGAVSAGRTAAPPAPAEDHTPRRPAQWDDGPWDGRTPPW